MQNRNLNKKALDKIGRHLFESSASASDDIDAIVENPYLFDRVRARIVADQNARPAVAIQEPRVRFFGRNAVVLASIAGFIVAVFGALSLFRPDANLIEVKRVQIPDAVPEVARPEVPPQPFVGKLSAGRASKADFKVENAVPNRRRARRQAEAEPEAEFYPVGYTGDPAETAGGGRIIRVDMKRSSLFALGINLPLENENETVKADLLVGSDGVTRALRIVN
jgi:hypothetical protein